MKVLLVGRAVETEMTAKLLRKSPEPVRIFCWPPQAANQSGLENLVASDRASPAEVARSAKNAGIDFVVLTSREAVTSGIANVLEVYRIPCFGPNRVASHFIFDETFLAGHTRRHRIPLISSSIHTSAQEAQSKALAILGVNGVVTVTAEGYSSAPRRVTCRRKAEVERAFVDTATSGDGHGIAYYRVASEIFGVNCTYICLANGDQIIPAGLTMKMSPTNESHQDATATGDTLATHAAYTYEPRIARELVEPFVRDLNPEGSPYVGWLIFDLVVARNSICLREVHCTPDEELIRCMETAAGIDWLAKISALLGVSDRRARGIGLTPALGEHRDETLAA